MSSSSPTAPANQPTQSSSAGPNSPAQLASAWIPVLVCIGAIALESTATFGADHTTGPLQRLFEWILNRHFTQPQWWRLHLTIRKVGHFTGYGILSIAWFRAFWMTFGKSAPFSRRLWTSHGLAMLGTLLIASSDELHQLFLPNRSGSVVDVGIDCLGGLTMQVLVTLWMRRTA